MSTINTLKLRNFRSYDENALRDINTKSVILHGPNGAGKTNILEAISMLCPGRGLRGARMPDIQKHNEHSPWAVAAKLHTPYGPVNIGAGLEHINGKRIGKINGHKAKSINALGEHISAIWLTPQMDGLFIGPSSERRRFLDRLIFAFDRAHNGRLTRYAKAMSERSKLLRSESNETSWLDSLEAQMAETGIAIAAARVEAIAKLSNAHNTAVHESFPRGLLCVRGIMEDALRENTPALDIEDHFKQQLRLSRGVDMLTGGAAVGPHKSDLNVLYADKNMPAGQSSTGEQKALLIGLILAHAHMIKHENGQLPILLLDEIAAHLDEGRCAALYNILDDIGCQVWFTGTELSLFTPITQRATTFNLENSNIRKVA